MTTLLPDLASSAVQLLRAYLPFQALVTSGLIGTDAVYPQGWVFQRTRNSPSSYRIVEGTGKCAVVLSSRGTWTAPNMHNTAKFPALQVEIFADCTRDSSAAIIAEDADRKCSQVYGVLDSLFHDVGSETISSPWPLGFVVASCLRSSELTISDVPEGDGSVRGIVYYAVVQLS